MCSALKQLFLLVSLAVVGAAIALAQAPARVASAGFDMVITNATIVTMDVDWLISEIMASPSMDS